MNNEVKELMRKANSGDTLSQFKLAQAYFAGKVTGEPNIPKGLEWAEKAGKDGDAFTKFLVGEFYNSLGFYSNAFEWFQKAAAGGCNGALTQLAACYIAGTGCDKNEEKAFYYAKKAFQNGDQDNAAMILGVLYFRGKVVTQSITDAYKYFKIAKANWNKEASEFIDQLESAMPKLKNL